jgi:hypothetical protein
MTWLGAATWLGRDELLTVLPPPGYLWGGMTAGLAHQCCVLALLHTQKNKCVSRFQCKYSILMIKFIKLYTFHG